ncbi:MAG: response regulator [Deltaproteobacteria bacterium]|nr:response regulator [Candidatus Tharpella aukensis]
MNILVVDDDPGIVELLVDLLQDLDYRVECAANGVEALARMDAKEFDLMLTDINMPLMDGMELIHQVKARKKSPIIIVITAYASMQSAIDALKFGVYDYITKPFNLDIVSNAVERALEKQFLQRENINLKEMMSLYRASELIGSQSGLDELVKVLFSAAASLTKTDFMALYLDDASNGEKGYFKLNRRQLFHEMTAAERYLISSLPKKLSYTVAKEYFLGQSSKIFKENDPLLTTFFSKSQKPIHFSSMMAFSLKAHNRLVGVLLLVSFTPEVIFLDKLRRSFYMLVSKAAACIETVYLNDNLQRQYIETVESFAQALEAKDSYTHGHSRQVSHYSTLIARQLGFPNDELATLHQAAILHDIGKIGISDTILNFSGELSENEFSAIREHPRKGRNILAPISSLAGVVEVVYHHHEHWDGNGYPEGLIGREIPLMARIIGVADAFDAMTSQRPYRSPLSLEKAFAVLQEEAGKQFDPDLVGIFISRKDEVAKLLEGHRELEHNLFRRKTDQKISHSKSKVVACG